MNPSKEKIPESIEKRARFDIVRYAGCWEDAEVLVKALQIKRGGAYLSIASAGDNSLSLLTQNPSLVVALDINPIQLACVEIRKAAFKLLSYQELLEFLGVHPHQDRLGVYARINSQLSQEAMKFWDEHPELIQQGIIHIGKFENYFRLFRTKILPLIHAAPTIHQLLNIEDAQERMTFYQKKWNTWRWRLLFKIFFSRFFMGRLGRDPEFFKYVETDVASRIFKRAEYALTELSTNNNPYLEYILTGNFNRALPHYLWPENFDLIRDNLDKLVVFQGNIQEAFQAHDSVKFDGYNLSDIFEYMSLDEYRKQLEIIIQSSSRGARLVFWNMLAERKQAPGLEGKLTFDDQEADVLFKQDKAFFYKSLVIGEVV